VGFSADVPGRKIKATVTFSGYCTSSFCGMTMGLMNASTGFRDAQYRFYYNTGFQHQGWSFQWLFDPGVLSTPGAFVTICASVLADINGGSFVMDFNDSAFIAIEELVN
jgi:hypothetical protein